MSIFYQVQRFLAATVISKNRFFSYRRLIDQKNLFLIYKPEIMSKWNFLTETCILSPGTTLVLTPCRKNKKKKTFSIENCQKRSKNANFSNFEGQNMVKTFFWCSQSIFRIKLCLEMWFLKKSKNFFIMSFKNFPPL